MSNILDIKNQNRESDQKDVETLDRLYKAVFDEDGNEKACGREACQELIEYVYKMDHVYVGNPDTGFITKPDLLRRIYEKHTF